MPMRRAGIACCVRSATSCELCPVRGGWWATAEPGAGIAAVVSRGGLDLAPSPAGGGDRTDAADRRRPSRGGAGSQPPGPGRHRARTRRSETRRPDRVCSRSAIGARLIKAHTAAVLHARDRAGAHPWTCTDEEFGRPTRGSGNDHPERTRAPWQKRDPRPRVLGSRQTRSFLASTRGVRIPGFLGDAASQRAARVAGIGRLGGRDWGCVILFGSNRLAMTPYAGPRVIQRSSANGLAERATAASSARALPRRLDDI